MTRLYFITEKTNMSSDFFPNFVSFFVRYKKMRKESNEIWIGHCYYDNKQQTKGLLFGEGPNHRDTSRYELHLICRANSSLRKKAAKSTRGQGNDEGGTNKTVQSDKNKQSSKHLDSKKEILDRSIHYSLGIYNHVTVGDPVVRKPPVATSDDHLSIIREKAEAAD